MPIKNSDTRRRELGAELRRRRELAGFNGLELARKMGWSQSTVSRIESGQGMVSEVNVLTYLAHCGVPAPEVEDVLLLARETEEGYLVRRNVLRTLILQETTASAITATAPLLIPGLLQTEEYTRSMVYQDPGIAKPDAETRISVRMNRKSLFKRFRPPQFTYFLYEAALRCPMGGNQVMNEQMLHLAFLCGRPQLALRVVPFASGSYAACVGEFTLMEYAEHNPVTYLENHFVGLFAESPDDIAASRVSLKKLEQDALDERESRTFLAQLASDYDRPDQRFL
jgi:transcriptional regulator with XRE-family HTH domain